MGPGGKPEGWFWEGQATGHLAFLTFSIRISKPPAQSPCLSSEWWKHEPKECGRCCRLWPAEEPTAFRRPPSPDFPLTSQLPPGCAQAQASRFWVRWADGGLTPSGHCGLWRLVLPAGARAGLVPVFTISLCSRASFCCRLEFSCPRSRPLRGSGRERW